MFISCINLQMVLERGRIIKKLSESQGYVADAKSNWICVQGSPSCNWPNNDQRYVKICHCWCTISQEVVTGYPPMMSSGRGQGQHWWMLLLTFQLMESTSAPTLHMQFSKTTYLKFQYFLPYFSVQIMFELTHTHTWWQMYRCCTKIYKLKN